MIVNVRLEVTDEQRNALARMNNPRAEKRLATRQEFVEYVERAIAQIGIRRNFTSVAVDLPPTIMVDADAKQMHRITEDGAPEDPVKADLFRVNNAIFALGRCRGTEKFSERDHAVEALSEYRARLVDEIGGQP